MLLPCAAPPSFTTKFQIQIAVPYVYTFRFGIISRLAASKHNHLQALSNTNMLPRSASFLEQLRQILELNNHGADLIEARDFKNAVDSLAAALALSKQRAIRDAAEEGESESQRAPTAPAVEDGPAETMESSSTSAKVPLNQQQQQGSLLSYSVCQTEATREDGQESAEEDSSPFIYRYPIRCPFQESQFENCVLLDLDVTLSAAIIFNLALAHHLYATERERSSESDPSLNVTMLEKSVRLYEFAHHLLTRQQGLDLDIVFLMATINNLGHAHKALNASSPKAQNCFQQLMSVLMLLTDGSEEERNNIAFLAGFMSTAVLSINAQNNFAAAA
jgi:hypothetical protein